MEALKTFLSKFEVAPEQIGDIHKYNKHYFIGEQAIVKDDNLLGSGLYLGYLNNNKEFTPSPAIMEIIAKNCEQKIYVDEKAEWLFLCGRDLFGKSIIKTNVQEGLVLVQNEHDENLGYGKIISKVDTNSSKVVVKNILDKGYYLRRERK